MFQRATLPPTLATHPCGLWRFWAQATKEEMAVLKHLIEQANKTALEIKKDKMLVKRDITELAKQQKKLASRLTDDERAIMAMVRLHASPTWRRWIVCECWGRVPCVRPETGQRKRQLCARAHGASTALTATRLDSNRQPASVTHVLRQQDNKNNSVNVPWSGSRSSSHPQPSHPRSDGACAWS